jgi:hypothetical protein
VDNGEASVARVRAAILEYLEHNSSAADTLDGIIGWWLPIEQRGIGRDKIDLALELLVADGLVKATSLIAGTILYSRGSKR